MYKSKKENILKKCYVCGKEFLPTTEYVYKINSTKYGTIWCCSYTCFNKAKQMLEDNDRRKKSRFREKKTIDESD